MFPSHDLAGPVLRCVEATVLEKETKAPGFIAPASGAAVPSGTYMKINPNNFSTTRQDNAIVTPGVEDDQTSSGGDFPFVKYPLNLDPVSPSTTYTDYSVPSGSRVVISIRQERLGTGDGDRNCERRINTIDVELISSQDYDNMSDFFYCDRD